MNFNEYYVCLISSGIVPHGGRLRHESIAAVKSRSLLGKLYYCRHWMAHADAWQWKPDEIWFDNLHSYGTPDYYVQRVFASNTGTRVIPITPQHTTESGAALYTSAVLDERTNELIVKAINYSPNARPAQIKLQGISSSGTAKVTTLESPDLKTENSFDQPKAIAPVSSTVAVSSGTIDVQLQPYSLTVYRIPVQ